MQILGIKNFKHLAKNASVVFMVFAWIFGGWPQFNIVYDNSLLSFPPKIELAEAITCGFGAEIGSTGVCRGYLTTADSSPWTKPGDWNDSDNTIEVIGGGGGGGAGTSGGGGGGGGAYSISTNVTVSGATAVFGVGTGGTSEVSGGNTWFNATSFANCTTSTTCASAAGGTAGSNATAGSGGATGIGTRNNGGDGGVGLSVGSHSSGGGGGAGGPNGVGAIGGDGDSNSGGQEAQGGGGGAGGGDAGVAGGANGGAGGANFANSTGSPGGGASGGNGTDGSDATDGAGGGGGDDGFSGGDGGDGTEWDATHGAGGGGGGGGDTTDTGGNGGLYGGGGGGVDATSGGGTGGAGLIVITYTPPDVTAPTPDPATFSTAPFNEGVSQVSMIATAGTDTSTPIEYLFTFTACDSDGGTGGTSSSWQQSTSYSDSGLQTNQCYGYTIQSRDSVPNTGTASSRNITYTSAAVPGAPTISNVTETTFDLTNDANGNPSSNPTTNFAVQIVNTSDGTWNNQYVDTDGTPSASAVWMSDATIDALTVNGLSDGTDYDIQVKARNNDGDETTFGTATTETTTAGVGETQDPQIYSAQNQVFVISQSSTAISPLAVSASTTAGITTGHDIRIAIATTSGFGMEWDTTDTSAVITGSASGKVSTTVSYPSPSELLIDVTTNFGSEESITISGLSYRNFTAPAKSGTGAFRLYTAGAVSGTPSAASPDLVTIRSANTAGGQQGSTISKPPYYLSSGSGLIAYYTFDGKNMMPNVRDLSGQANHGNLTHGGSGTSTTPGKIGQALSFDGSDDYVGVANNTPLQITGDMTISTWFRLRSTPSNGAGLVSVGISGETLDTNILYQLSIDTTSGNDIKIGHEYNTGTDQISTFDTNLSLGEWYHITAVRDTTALTWTLYINGVPFSGGPYTFTNNTEGGSTGIFAVGRYASTNIYIPADMDDVRIYGRALSASEVLALRHSGSTKISASNTGSTGGGLVGYWTFDGKTMYNNVQDSSGQGNHGSLVTGASGNTGTTTAPGKLGQALVFDGVDDYVETALTDTLGDFTACAWFYSKGNDASARIIGKNYTSGFWVGRNPSVADQWGGGVLEPDDPYGIYVTLPDNAWNHICSIRSGTTHTIVGNGGAVSTSNTVSGSLLSSTNLSIGSSSSLDANFFNGVIDQVRVYSRSLSDAEVLSLYNRGRTRVRQ